MKFLKILAPILLILAMGAGIMTYIVDTSDMEKIDTKVEELKTEMTTAGITDEAEQDKMITKAFEEKGSPTSSTLNTASMIAILLVFLTFFALVTVFMDMSPKITKPLVAVIIIVSIVSIILHPDVDKGSHGGISNQVSAILHGALAMIGSIVGMIYKDRVKKG